MKASNSKIAEELIWKDNPLFILGYSKSGTSLLVALLDNHPQLVVIPEETDFIDTLYFFCDRIKKDPSLKDGAIEVICEVVFQRSHLRNLQRGKIEKDIGGNFDYSDFDFVAFKQVFKNELRRDPLSPGKVFKAIAIAYKAASKLHYEAPIYWVEKTPYHEYHLWDRKEIMNEMFDANYKILHIVRDPRDNYLAYKKKHPNLTVVDFCFEWKRVLQLINNFKDQNRFEIVKYEDLVLHPNESIQKISHFLKIDNLPILKNPSKYGNLWKGNSMFGNKSNSISTNAVGRYKSAKDTRQIEIIEHLLQKEMEKYQYKIETPNNLSITTKIFQKTIYQFNLIKRWFKYRLFILKEYVRYFRLRRKALKLKNNS